MTYELAKLVFTVMFIIPIYISITFFKFIGCGVWRWRGYPVNNSMGFVGRHGSQYFFTKCFSSKKISYYNTEIKEIFTKIIKTHV